MSRRRNSKALTALSWGVLKQHRYLLRFPYMGFVVSLIPILLAVTTGFGATVAQDDGNDGLAVILGILTAVFVFIILLIGNVFTGALVTSAISELRGRPSSFAAGLSAAKARLGVLAKWSFIELVVSALLNRARGNGRGGTAATVGRGLLAGTAGLLWSLVTFMVMPVLMNEDISVKDAITRSAHLLKGRWGDQIKVRARVGGLLILALVLPAIAAVIGGLAMMAAGGVLTAIGIPVTLLGLLVFGFALLLSKAVQGVFSAVLYLYAIDGEAPAGFTQEQLAGAVGS